MGHLWRSRTAVRTALQGIAHVKVRPAQQRMDSFLIHRLGDLPIPRSVRDDTVERLIVFQPQSEAAAFTTGHDTVSNQTESIPRVA